MTPALQRHAYDPVRDRHLFSLPVESSTPSNLDLGSKHFACLLAWDALGATHDEVRRLVHPLYLQGLSYLVCWGPDCERVHDIADEIEISRLTCPEIPPDSVIMTTWHTHESLEEAIWFLLNVTAPDPAYFDTTRATLAIAVRNDAWLKRICKALDDPSAFSGEIP